MPASPGDAIAHHMIDLLSKGPGPEPARRVPPAGNQQKVVMARWPRRATRSSALVDHPDRRVRREARKLLLEAVGETRRGAASSVVSDELDDLRLCDRLLVMFQRPDRRGDGRRMARPRPGGGHGRSPLDA